MTFNLREGRDRIEKASKGFADPLLLKNLFLNVRKQDAEFIRLLKEALDGVHAYEKAFDDEPKQASEIIDRLAGEKFHGS